MSLSVMADVLSGSIFLEHRFGRSFTMFFTPKTLISCLSLCESLCVSFRTLRAGKVSSQLVLLGSHTEVVQSEFCSNAHSVCAFNQLSSRQERNEQGSIKSRFVTSKAFSIGKSLTAILMFNLHLKTYMLQSLWQLQ